MYKVKLVSFGDYSLSCGTCLEQPAASPLVGHQDDKCPFIQQSSTDTATMPTGENNSLQASIECDPSSTTCFVENDTVVRQDFSAVPLPDDIEIRLTSIKDFLAKPLLVTTINWTTANLANANIWSSAIKTIVTSTSAWTNKFQGFQLMRGDFVIKLKINANPFQSGLLMLHFLPCEGDYNAASYAVSALHNVNLVTKIQQPHVELNCRDAACEMRIPYITPGSYYDIKLGVYDWGSLFLDVMSPLRVGAAGTTNLNISVYCSIENAVFAAPIVPQMGKQGRLKGRVYSHEEEKMDTNSVSGALAKVSSVAMGFHDIPIIGALAEPVSWAARVAGGVASIFGWSKPQCESAIMPMTKQELRYGATSDGHDMAFPIALLQDNRIKMISDKTITDQDEMSFAFLKRIPLLLNSIGTTWDTSQASGVVLMTQAITPLSLLKSGSTAGSTNTTNWVTGPPWLILANEFCLWRGSVDITFKFIKTEFHTGMLEITWSPATVTGVLPTTSTSIFSLREVIDIRYQSEITLNMPYMVYIDWLHTIGTPNISGNFRISVVNSLRAPENASQTIEFMTYITAGDDFEYAIPGTQHQFYAPYYPQSGGETIINTGIAESARRGSSTKFTELCIGETFTSIKQLLNRFSQVYFKASLPSAVNKSVAVWPWFSGVQTSTAVTGVPIITNVGGDTYGLFSQWYAFYRGSMRIMISPSQTTAAVSYPIDMTLTNQTNIGNAVVNSGFDYGSHALKDWSSTTVNTVRTGGITETDNTTGAAYARIPYQAATPISLSLGQITAFGNVPIERSQPFGSINFYSDAGTFNDYAMYRSAGDDFQFMYFIGCPPYVTSVV